MGGGAVEGGAGAAAAREGFVVGIGIGAARVGVFFLERKGRGREAARGGEGAGTDGGAVISAAAASGHGCVKE